MEKPVNILITGASSGIGEALALAYARPGVFIAVTGRNRERLDRVAADLRQRGAEVEAKAIDVRDRETMAAWINDLDHRRPVDLVVANAGISAGTGGAGEAEEQMRTIMAVNLDGVMNTVWPLIPRMRERKNGQIAIVSSIAGFRGLPSAPAYSASKAAVKAWGEALRGWLAEEGIRVSVICPGYVVSRMTDANDFPMPFLMPTERAAAIVVRGLERDKARIIFPWPMAIAAWLLGALPPGITDGILSRMPRKGGST